MSNKKDNLTVKMDKFEADLEWFYGEEFNLDQAVERYEKMMKMAQDIEADLLKMKNKIIKIEEDFSK